MDEIKQKEIREKSMQFFEKAGVYLTEEEKKNKIQIVEFPGEDYSILGLAMVNFINIPRYCGKFILFFPNQTCMEHWHPSIQEKPGKEETFRVLWGQVYAYVDGEKTTSIKAKIPAGKEEFFTQRHEVVLNPGDQYSVKANEKHWWQAGPDGAIALEVSSQSFDEYDLFTGNAVSKIY